MAAGKEGLYVKLDQSVEVSKQDVALGDVAQLECTDRNVQNRLRAARFCQVTPDGRGKFRRAYTVLDVVRAVHEVYPGLEIQSLGEADFVLTYVRDTGPHPLRDWVKTVAVGVVIFFGAAFSIMAFNNDISVTKLFAQIHEQVTGEESDGYTALEISYSVGLSVGVLLFFNHFWGKRLTSDPTPIEVEMKMYEKDVNETLIQESGREAKGRHGSTANTDGAGRL